jgi:hypothetical protein
MFSKLKSHKIILTLILLTLIKFVLIYSFHDKGWEPDSYQHYNELYTVYSNFPNNLDIGLGVWSKPLYSYVLGIPAAIVGANGLWIIQVCNAVIFSFISYLVYLIVKSLYKKENLAFFSLLLTQLSFLTFRSSITALTEPIFTLMLVLGLFYAVKRKYYLATFFFSLSILGRIEGLLFIGIYNLWLVYEFRNQLKSKWLFIFKNWVLSIIPMFIWNFLGYLQTGKPLYLFSGGYPTNSEETYGTGSWVFFFKSMLLHETVISILFALSILILIKNFLSADRQARKLKISSELLLTSSLFIAFFLSQVVTWKFGLFGSAGLIRYFISIMPFGVIVGVLVLDTFFSTKSPKPLEPTRSPLSVLPVITMVYVSLITLQILSLITLFVGIGPIESKWIHIESDEFENAGLWIKENVDESIFVGSERPEVIYYAGRNLENSTIFQKDELESNKAGIYVWSKSWGEEVAGIKFEDISEKAELVKQFGEEIYIFKL